MTEQEQKEFDALKERVDFLEAIIQMHAVNGENQFNSEFTDWKKKQGLYRDSRL